MGKIFAFFAFTLYYLSISSYCFADMEIYEKDFKIFWNAQPTSFDPQATHHQGSIMLSQHIFDPLFTVKNGRPAPILVESYQHLTPTLWEFTLKKGVKFHDGSELTTKDVVATFNRGIKLKYKKFQYFEGVALTALDKYHFQIESPEANANLLWNLDFVIIKHTAESASKEQFEDGTYLVGSGPYKLTAHDAYQAFNLEAFNDYHRGKPYLQKVKIHVEPDDSKRVKAYLEGKADLIDVVPTDKVNSLETHANMTNETGHFLYIMFPDMHHDQSPDIRDHKGKKLNHNPLKDLRVRKAISLALDRDSLVTQIYGMNTGAQAAGQLVNDQVYTSSRHLHPPLQNISEARRLLTEAGYPQGFMMKLTDKDGRRGHLEKIATMLKEIGIQAEVQTFPPSVYFKQFGQYSYSMGCLVYTAHGNLEEMLNSLLYKGKKTNWYWYDNQEFDRVLEEAAQQTSDVVKRRKLREATEIALKDWALIPIMFRPEIWAIRKDMFYEPTDQHYTEAFYVQPHAQVSN